MSEKHESPEIDRHLAAMAADPDHFDNACERYKGDLGDACYNFIECGPVDMRAAFLTMLDALEETGLIGPEPSATQDTTGDLGFQHPDEALDLLTYRSAVVAMLRTAHGMEMVSAGTGFGQTDVQLKRQDGRIVDITICFDDDT